jgi:cytochrome P450
MFAENPAIGKQGLIVDSHLTPPSPDLGQLPSRQLWAFYRRPLDFLSDLARKFGDLAHFRIGPQGIYLLNHPAYIETILERDRACFDRGPATGKAYLSHGPLTCQGESTFRMRDRFRMALDSQRLDNRGLLAVEAALQTGGGWSHGLSVDMWSEMRRLALHMAARMLFDENVEERAALLAELAVRLRAHSIIQGWPLAGWLSKLCICREWRMKSAELRLDSEIQAIAAARQGASGDQGLIGLLLGDQESNAGQPGMGGQATLRYTIASLLAGYESIASWLAWTCYLLAKHPQAQATLHAELDCALSGRVPVPDDLESLVYTRMALAEALRLYPPVWLIQRRAIQDYRLDGYLIPAGDTILISPWIMQRDLRYYPKPERFDPQRWAPAAIADRPPYAYFPFGGGSVACPAEDLAWTEAALILSTLAQVWRWRLAPGQAVTLQAAAKLRPKNDIRLQIERRAAYSNLL